MNAEAVALFLAGLVAPWLVKVFNRAGWKGPRALWLSFVVSVVLAVIAQAATGGLATGLAWDDPVRLIGELAARAGVVFALGQLVFQSLKDRMELNPP